MHHEKFQEWFKVKEQKRSQRKKGKLLVEVPTRTKEYDKSAIPAMVRLINANPEEVKKAKARPECGECAKSFLNEDNL